MGTGTPTDVLVEAQPELVGRSAEIELLSSLLERSSAAEFSLAFIDGEAGIGKTRVMLELAGRVRASKGIVLRGSSPPSAGQPVPFAAVSQALRDALRQLSETEREAIVVETPELGHLLPAWRLAGASPPSGTSLTVICEQFLYVIDRLARERTVAALLLDDLQWADSATLDLIAYVVRSLGEARVLMVLAARIDELPSGAPLRRIRAELVRAGATSVRLGPLDSEAAAQLVETLRGRAIAGPRQRRIAELAQGNPFFLQELALLGDDGGSVPESVRDLIRARFASLDDAERVTLRVIAVAGEALTSDIILDVAGQPSNATLEGLRRLIDGSLLSERDDGTVSMIHPLVRDVILAEVIEAERRRIHAAVAQALATQDHLGRGTDAERLVRIANHWLGAGDRIRTFAAMVKAADASERAFAFTTAFELFRKALDQVAVRGDTHRRRFGFEPPVADAGFADLRRRAAEAAILAGEPGVAIQWIDDTLREVERSPLRDQLELTRARCLAALGEAAAAVGAYSGLLARIPKEELPGSARIGLARALVATGRAGEAVSVAEEALSSARASRSTSEEEAALLVLGTALAHTGDAQAGVRRWQEARSLRRASASRSAIRPRPSRVMDLTAGLADAARVAYRTGLAEDAAALTSDAAAAAARWGAAGEAARLDVAKAQVSIDLGDWDEALKLLDAAADSRVARAAALALRARLAAWRGSWERAAADLAECEGRALAQMAPEDRVAFWLALVELRMWRRQLDEAADAATEGMMSTQAASAANHLELVELAIRVRVEQALAARAVRADAEAVEFAQEARGLLAETDRRSRRNAGPRAIALVETARAEVRRLDADNAETWVAAGQAWLASPGVWWTGYAAFREAEASLGEKSGRGAARAALIRANTIARRLEAAPLVTEIESLASRARIDLHEESRPPRPAETTRKLPISDRELEVLMLIANGKTNREIASELFISERTAAHHVSHIFDKLGVTSRVEAAGMAHRAGILDGGPASS